MQITVPKLSLVVLIGASGSGKSTFARTHFWPTEVVSSDVCRGIVADDENDQAATPDAFELLHFIASKRLAAGRLTVIDATNVQSEARRPLIALARAHHVLPVAVVFNLPEAVCQARNAGRPDRQFGPHVVRNQSRELRRSLGSLQREGFRHVFLLPTEAATASVTIVRQPLWSDRRADQGPFDLIGDIHGCFTELKSLLGALGYQVSPQSDGHFTVAHPEGRRVVFLGDLVDRGPEIVQVLRLAMDMVAAGSAICLTGNHEQKLLRMLNGRNVQISHGLAETLTQLEAAPESFQSELVAFLEGLVGHLVFDGGRLVAAHAGMKEKLQGRASNAVRQFALYGETTGETDEFGLPVRYDWASEYRGKALVAYGHMPVASPDWLNNTINIDTGCVFGGQLTALRYPERQLVSAPAARTYYAPSRPLTPALPDAPTAQQAVDDLLDYDDISGKRIIQTRLMPAINIREENAMAALEVMSRFAIDPKWLIYLPPTMSPSETSRRPELLEHPDEALAYFRGQGLAQVICEQKHMGSRAVVVICRTADSARRRFGVRDGFGACYTRTGRRFFAEPDLEAEFLTRLQSSVSAANLWSELDTDWLALDCELMPWSMKAQELLRRQYAATASAAHAGLTEALTGLSAAVDRGVEAGGLLERFQNRDRMVQRYAEAYQRYCWPVIRLEDLKLAPFHLLASEGAVHVDRTHLWHMETLAHLAIADPALLMATPFLVVDPHAERDAATAVAWWQSLTASGGEGMVVKPLEFIALRGTSLVQPAVKCRGPEYLRIIYGPEYLAQEHLERLRTRGTSAKRALALREFALGIEALERFVRREPLRRVHECVFGVLALESEPVDPRL